MTWEEALSKLEVGVPVQRTNWNGWDRQLVLVDSPSGEYVGISTGVGKQVMVWHVDSGWHAPDLEASNWQEVPVHNRYPFNITGGHTLRSAK